MQHRSHLHRRSSRAVCFNRRGYGGDEIGYSQRPNFHRQRWPDSRHLSSIARRALGNCHVRAELEPFRSTLEAVLDGNIDVERLVEKSQSTLFRKRMPKVMTSIQVDNEASALYTVVEVYTADRLGILFRITYTLHQLGLSIHVAKISTNVDQVADVFFVTTERGGKVEDSARIEAIRQTLYASLVPDDERIAAPLH